MNIQRQPGYYAKGNKVYVQQLHLPLPELFLTVHETNRGDMTLAKQAEVIAEILNEATS